MTEVLWSLHDLACVGPDDCTCKQPVWGATPVRSAPKPTPLLREVKHLKPKARGIPAAVKRAVFERDKSTCQWCQVGGGALDVHHIQRRSQGGKDELDNLVAVHRLCHSYIHEHPTEAKARGFLLNTRAVL